jgi:uncharacterized DUF497 family protein
VEFEWDDAKDSSNQEKHGVSFDEARTLFTSGDDYLKIFDADHSDSEDRFTPSVRSLAESWSSCTPSATRA